MTSYFLCSSGDTKRIRDIVAPSQMYMVGAQKVRYGEESHLFVFQYNDIYATTCTYIVEDLSRDTIVMLALVGVEVADITKTVSSIFDWRYNI